MLVHNTVQKRERDSKETENGAHVKDTCMNRHTLTHSSSKRRDKQRLIIDTHIEKTNT